MYKYELHAHTSECDLYAKASGAELVRACYDKGYSGIVITDHYFKYFFKWFEDELKNATHDEKIGRYLKGYHCAKNEGEKLGISVISGAEVRLPDSDNDYLIYGLDEDDFFSLPLLCELPTLDELRLALPKKALIVQAHPFRVGMTISDPELLFGIEVNNGGTEPFRNKMALEYAAHLNMPMTSGSDCHSVAALGRGGIQTEKKINTSNDLISVLTEERYSLILQ